MTKLSPQAMRFVEQAIVLQGNSRKQSDWLSWAMHPDTDIPPHIAHIAIQALSGMALYIEDRIESGKVDAAEAANLENDLGYIADIESDLTGSLV